MIRKGRLKKSRKIALTVYRDHLAQTLTSRNIYWAGRNNLHSPPHELLKNNLSKTNILRKKLNLVSVIRHKVDVK